MSDTKSPEVSATVLLLRERDGLEVLMIERGKQAYYGSALVFPGGKMDASDRSEAWIDFIDDVEISADARALRIAGLREVHEETGILILNSAVPFTSDARTGTFIDHVRSSGERLPISRMQPLARWITPEDTPRRFDTHFYLCPCDSDDAICDGIEAVSAEWIAPEKALAGGESGRFRVLFPTKSQLRRIASFTSLKEVFAAAASSPVCPITPAIVQRDGRRFLAIPPGRGYDVCEEEI